VPVVPSEAELRLNSLQSTQTTASPTVGIVITVHVSRTPGAAPEPQPTTVASCRSMTTRPPGLATRATLLPLVIASPIPEAAPGLRPTTVTSLRVAAIRQLCLATSATTLLPPPAVLPVWHAPTPTVLRPEAKQLLKSISATTPAQ
jgi:hypothetical protein